MAISLRLEPDMERQVAAAAASVGLSKSEFVRRCIAEQLQATSIDRAKLAWELGKDVFGKYGSGRSDISENHKGVLEEIFAQNKRERDAKRRDR